MARYPTFEDYEKRGNFVDGIKRCDELLKKSPQDLRLLTTRLRLLYATADDGAQAVLDEIVSIPMQDLQDIIAVEEAVIASHRVVYPRPATTGPSVSKIWENAVKATSSLNQKLEIVSVRFERAVLDSRLVDAQQALIQMKAIQPRNRVVYMAHAAFTQLISKSNDDLQARLALGLARKAVTEKFDDDTALDCRVPGQIFALQRSEKDLESITGRAFQESKHVFDSRRPHIAKANINGSSMPEIPDPATVSATEWLTAEIKALKYRFADMREGSNAETVRAFAANAIRLFRTSLSIAGARRSPADACFIAISALVKLFELLKDPSYLLQAAYLAESLLQHDEHIHEARLILVYLYMRLGLGSLAMQLFDSLNVKEVQHDTIGHVLFTGLSLIHPHPTSWTKKEGLDPLKRTSHALKVYDRCEDKLAETEASLLGNGQTGMVFDLQELRDSLSSSVTRRIAWLEHRRIGRLAKGSVGDYDEKPRLTGPRVVGGWLHTKDNRDLDAAFDFRYNVERVLYRREGTVPSKTWMLYGLAADTAWCLANEKTALVVDPEEILRQIEGLKPEASGMTDAEWLAGNVAACVLRMMVSIVGSTDAAKDDSLRGVISETTKCCKSLNIDSLISEEQDPLADLLLDHYAYADVLRIVVSGCNLSVRKCSSDLQEPLKQLRNLAKRSLASLQQHATKQQTRIKASTVRQQISQDEGLSRELQQIGSGGYLDTFCENMAASAREGWEGLMKLQVV